MRRSCKHINIRDPKTVYPWVRECIDRHKERDDFRRLLINVGGMDPAEYYRAMRENLDEPFDGPSMRIAIAATQGISRRDLRLSRPRIKERVDGSSGKLRKIGRESAMQQVYDHIADKSCGEIWRRRIVDQQFSSRKGYGTVAGAHYLRDKKQADNRAARWAAAHGQRYSKRMRYHVKLDIRQCFRLDPA